VGSVSMNDVTRILSAVEHGEPEAGEQPGKKSRKESPDTRHYKKRARFGPWRGVPMAIRLDGRATQQIRTLRDWGTLGSWTDGQLLTEFLTGEWASDPTLRVLIERHGPMVLRVCRRILGDEGAAEDASQATFLVLIRKADSLRGCEGLTKWLYAV